VFVHYVTDAALNCLLRLSRFNLVLTINVGYNPFSCDCMDYNIISTARQYYALSPLLDSANCAEPSHLYNHKVGLAQR